MDVIADTGVDKIADIGVITKEDIDEIDETASFRAFVW